MKTEIKEKWVNALRSGEYEQGQGVLRSSDKFCCLGVLCDLYLNEVLDPDSYWQTDEFGKTWFTSFDRERGEDYDVEEFLPDVVIEWSELTNSDPEVIDKDECNSTISRLNDTDYTFMQIATIIEKQL
jgi:hypothetical protein